MEMIENRPYDELRVGDSAMLTRILTVQDIALFAAMSGDINPAHLDDEYARASIFHGVIGHGMWGGSLVSTVLGVQLPGPGTIYVSQTLNFKRPVKIGDEISVMVRLREKREHGRAIFDCECRNQHAETVIAGEAIVIAPNEKVKRPAAPRPHAVLYERGDRLKALIKLAKDGDPIRVGVVHPVNALCLEAAVSARRENLIEPVLIGPRAKIEAAAEAAGIDIGSMEIIDAPHSHAASASAVGLARDGRLDALMKGALHTDEMMAGIVASRGGLHTERRVSHVSVIDTPAYDKLLFLSDAAINVAPDLNTKRDILQNAIDLCRSLGVEAPKAAILSAVESVNPRVPSTLEAAALCKMAERGQIVGGIVDGPLAFDNAISSEAARAKELNSPVAGRADILVVPDLDAGNMLTKQLSYLAGAVSGGVVLGARAPIILTSRADGVLSRLASCAIAKLHHEAAGAPARIA